MLPPDHAAITAWRERRARRSAMTRADRVFALESTAQELRRDVLTTIVGAGQGHIGGDFSVLDLLTVMFEDVLRVTPESPAAPERDIFILSKGHAAASLYATLAHVGFFSKDALQTFMQPYSALNGHPAKAKVPGVETSTGPLGHGLPVAVGAALGARLRGADARVFVITGDGEMQEGSNWEALMSAAHFELSNLTLVIDRNRLQQGAGTEETNALDPLDQKLAAFGWEVRIIDGHDMAEIEEGLRPSTSGKPVAVIANTTKGRGISFMEDRAEWHHKVPSADQAQLAMQELS